MNLNGLELDGLELVDPNADYSGTQNFFVDFDGAAGISYDNDDIDLHIDSIDVENSGLTAEEQFQILTDLNETFADTGVTFTTTAPADEEYSTIYVGGDGSVFSEFGDFMGVSETIDVGNLTKDDEAFVFSDKMDSVSDITEIIAHEAGHLLGFSHEDNSVDDQFTTPILTTFSDGATQIIASDYSVEEYFSETLSISGNNLVVGTEYHKASPGKAYIYRWNGTSYDEIIMNASDGSAADRYGGAVSMSGDNVIIGASKDGDGSAYVYKWNGSSYEEITKLTASDEDTGENFGKAVSISGNNAIVGAGQGDGNCRDSGSAYVYRWDGSEYDEYKLFASDGGWGDKFGESVYISGDNVIVGAFQDDDHGSDSGSAYVYRWDGSDYVEYKLTASDGARDYRFGKIVSMDGDNVVVGAYENYSYTTAPGKAYVYRWNGESYDEYILSASDAVEDDQFGQSVSISGDYVLVGTKDSATVYIYHWNGSSYDEVNKLITPYISTTFRSSFGKFVSIEDDSIAVGAASEIIEHTSPDDHSVRFSFSYAAGAAYVYSLAELDIFATPHMLSDTVSISDVALDWRDSINDAVGIKEYIVQYANNRAFINAISQTVSASEMNISELDDAKYYWRVKSVNNDDEESNWSITNDFIVDNVAPQTPREIVNPVAGSIGASVDLDWRNSSSSLSGIKEYVVEYADNADFEGALTKSSSTSDIILNNLVNGTYYWHVKAVDNSNNASDWSSVNDFTVTVSNGSIKISPSDGEKNDIYNGKLSVSGDNIVVGTKDYRCAILGKAYVYRWNGTSYDEIIMNASDGSVADLFGSAASMSGDNMVIGASGSASAYVYKWNGSSYEEIIKLTASNDSHYHTFGKAVSISENNVIVGAERGERSGRAYVYRWNGASYYEYKLSSSDGNSGDKFGGAVSISGDNVIVGASEDDDNGTDSGSAYVYRWDGSEYDEYKLTASDGEKDDRFGKNVSIDGNNVVVGAYGNFFANNILGKAYVYRWNGESYDEYILTASDTSIGDRFGYSVSISGDYVLVGTDRSKAVYIYHWNGSSYDEVNKLTSQEDGNSFGKFVSIDGDSIVVGSDYDSQNYTGATYIFSLANPFGLVDTAIYSDVTLDWQDAFDSDSGIKEYVIEYADNIGFDDAIIQTSATSDLDLSNMADGTYYWHVKSVNNDDGESLWSITDSFVVDLNAASVPDGLSDPVSGSDVALDWNDSESMIGIKEYIVQYDDDQNFNSAETQTVVDSELTLNNMANGSYYWRVKAVNSDNEQSNWSEADKFYLTSATTETTRILDSTVLRSSLGDSLAVFEDIVVVGGLGATYIYQYSDDVWTETIVDVNDVGRYVSTDGENVIVGHGLYQWNETNWVRTERFPTNSVFEQMVVDGDRVASSSDKGVFLYEFNGSTWDKTVLHALKAGDPEAWNYPGQTLFIDGDIIVSGLNGDDSNGTNSGCAYIFKYNGTSWDETKIISSDNMADDNFGYSASVDGNTVVVGTKGNRNRAGSVYVYKWNGSEWMETKLTASDGENGDEFGHSVAVDGNTIIVGAKSDSNDVASRAGSAYVYQWNGSAWLEAKLIASDGESDDSFGNSVAIDGDRIVIGACGVERNSAGNTYVYSLADVDFTSEITPLVRAASFTSLNTEIVNLNDVSFNWTNPSTAVKYQIQVDNNDDFSSPEFDDESVDSETTFANLSNGTHNWRVRAYNNDAYGDWFQGDSFVVDTSSIDNYTQTQRGRDFDGNGKSDILWQRESDGRLYAWDDGDLSNGWRAMGSSPFSLVGMGDFDGSGTTDILWERESDGNLYTWDDGDLSNGWNRMGASPFKFAGIGDFDGNGTSDILWQRENDNRFYAWDDGDLSNGWRAMGTSPFTLLGIGDFDGNGTSDLLWERESDGRLYVWDDGDLSNGWNYIGTSPFTLRGIGDFDGNGTSDLLWERESDGSLYAWDDADLSNGWRRLGSSPFTMLDIGDYDGNGTSDILWQRESDGNLYSWSDGELANGWTKQGTCPDNFTLLSNIA